MVVKVSLLVHTLTSGEARHRRFLYIECSLKWEPPTRSLVVSIFLSAAIASLIDDS